MVTLEAAPSARVCQLQQHSPVKQSSPMHVSCSSYGDMELHLSTC